MISKGNILLLVLLLVKAFPALFHCDNALQIMKPHLVISVGGYYYIFTPFTVNLTIHNEFFNTWLYEMKERTLYFKAESQSYVIVTRDKYTADD